ncbi:hypothetical protein [Rudaea sp.]|uniref:hypothetical protein n=1 Tax=Rudaea sp. TaxID=2136325 RepID=UPI00321FE401
MLAQHRRNIPAAKFPHIRRTGMKGLGYVKGCQHGPEVEGGIAFDRQHLPDALAGRELFGRPGAASKRIRTVPFALRP